MKATEKQIIYNLLKTADAYECGYTREKFAVEPLFVDDVEKTAAEVTKPAENQLAENLSKQTEPEHSEPESNPSVNDKAAFVPAENSETGGISLDELNAKILRCTRCALARTRNNVVPGMGVTNPLVLVIGEGPGEEEDRQGKPFVGKAGILLDKMLNAINLDRNKNCYIANIVKCRPPENRNPLPEEEDACFSFLEAQIHILKPKMILCMGKVAAEKLLNESISINSQHGEFFRYNEIPVMPTYHPSALLRNESLKRPAWEDLKLFRKKLDELEGSQK